MSMINNKEFKAFDNKKFKAFALINIVLIFIAVAIGGILWDYSISSILIAMHKPDTFKLWMGYIMAIIPGFGQLCFPLAVIVWVVMLFI